MPFQRRFPKRPFKPRFPRKKVPQQTKRYVKTAITKRMPKRQFTYTIADGGEVTSTPTIDDLTAISQVSGSDDPELYRDQRYVKPLSLVIDGLVTAKTTSIYGNWMRVIVFQWKPNRTATTGDVPTQAEIFSAGASYPFTAPIFSDIDQAHMKVLLDKRLQMGVASDGSSLINPNISRAFRWYIPVSRLARITYNSQTGTTGNNHIYIAFVGNNTTGTNTSLVKMTSRLIYQ